MDGGTATICTLEAPCRLVIGGVARPRSQAIDPGCGVRIPRAPEMLQPRARVGLLLAAIGISVALLALAAPGPIVAPATVNPAHPTDAPRHR